MGLEKLLCLYDLTRSDLKDILYSGFGNRMDEGEGKCLIFVQRIASQHLFDWKLSYDKVAACCTIFCSGGYQGVICFVRYQGVYPD
ncbi:hypothetical protein MTBBW1_340043 [Desulfamplus magnetovallimortis]|uniref:Uncharacterized protein n=1 Tax=Desulfamplus magnetovallimortis TaxID=1246637 RepID=A0A1W1HG54_9BACT|nr:hypothetical protein MTBBW1_340043 [Desulfamplus magnetovallimortis]